MEQKQHPLPLSLPPSTVTLGRFVLNVQINKPYIIKTESRGETKDKGHIHMCVCMGVHTCARMCMWKVGVVMGCACVWRVGGGRTLR